jgi:putative oxidoreductase
LSLLRIMTGLLFLQYGMAKLLKFPAVPAFKDVTLFSLYGLAGTLELVGGALMILGLFTRPVAFILAGEMAFAYFSDMPRAVSCPSSMAAISRSCSALCRDQLFG